MAPQRQLIRPVRGCEDGPTQERALVDEARAWGEPEQGWVADRNFAPTRWVVGVVARGGPVVGREHASPLHGVTAGPAQGASRGATGSVTEQEVQSADEHGTGLRLRRITLRLDQPTQEGDRVIVGLTTLPAEVSAAVVVEVYRKRWRIEGAFPGLTVSLHCEPNTLGYPPCF